jgi:DNA mismatch repair protein MutL
MDGTPRRRITVMSAALSQRVAAGEVIERPGSVVRELVENALDAGAQSIRIEVRGGGLDLIAVSDDGQGISFDELPLAFARFATSKTLDMHDLEEVRTLGFRGEALAAVVAVSTVEAISSIQDGSSGARVVLRSGELLETTRVARSRGTTIRIQDLFAEQPVRRGFLPPARAEHAFILRLARLYALARPAVKISLDTDERRVFRTAGLGEAGALGAVFGANAGRLGAFGPLSVGRGTLHGYLGDPGFTRGDADGLVIVLNGRWVRPRAWLAELERAYRGLLPNGRHPVAVLYLEIEPRLVDVNLHPAKLEVRVQNEGDFLIAVSAAIREHLGNAVEPVTLLSGPGQRPHQRALPLPARAISEQPALYGELPNLAELRILGQIFDTAILAEGHDRLYLIDQHRADEQAIYEELVRDRKAVPNQELLEPLRLETRTADSEELEARIPELLSMGFRVERFGRRTFLVRSQPLGLPESTAPALVESLTMGVAPDGGWRTRLLTDVACRAAVKRGRTLTEHEMRDLLRRLQKCEIRAQCPHGSPIVATVKAEDLVRHFGWP